MNLKLLLLVLSILVYTSSFCQKNVYSMPDGIQTRWSSAENWKGEKGVGGMKNGGRKGSASFALKAGTEKVLAEVSGTSGMVRRIWCTIEKRTPKMLRGIRMEMFWDNAETPAVSAPLGDFFGQGLGQMKAFENVFFASPEGKSFLCLAPMPFKTAMKIVVKNETDEDIDMFFYDVDYTVGDRFDNEALYFHAWYNHQNPTEIRKDYEVLPAITGRGRFMGANFSVVVNTIEYARSWWGEGEVKMYIDGDSKYPTLCGTGTEDYIGTGWGQGEFSQTYQGCTSANGDKMEYAFYRYHVPDPVYFYQDIKVTIQQIGFAGEKEVKMLAQMKNPVYPIGEELKAVDFSKKMNGLLFERTDDVASCAYFYLDKPGNNLPRKTDK